MPNDIFRSNFVVCHAEMNAILNKTVLKLDECRMYVTLFPCTECAKLIVQSGIRKVIVNSFKLYLVSSWCLLNTEIIIRFFLLRFTLNPTKIGKTNPEIPKIVEKYLGQLMLKWFICQWSLNYRNKKLNHCVLLIFKVFQIFVCFKLMLIGKEIQYRKTSYGINWNNKYFLV